MDSMLACTYQQLEKKSNSRWRIHNDLAFVLNQPCFAFIIIFSSHSKYCKYFQTFSWAAMTVRAEALIYTWVRSKGMIATGVVDCHVWMLFHLLWTAYCFVISMKQTGHNNKCKWFMIEIPPLILNENNNPRWGRFKIVVWLITGSFKNRNIGEHP